MSHVSARSTRAVTASLADIHGVSPRELCRATMWSDTSVFAKFYRLDMVAAKGISNSVLIGVLSH